MKSLFAYSRKSYISIFVLLISTIFLSFACAKGPSDKTLKSLFKGFAEMHLNCEVIEIKEIEIYYEERGSWIAVKGTLKDTAANYIVDIPGMPLGIDKDENGKWYLIGNMPHPKIGLVLTYPPGHKVSTGHKVSIKRCRTVQYKVEHKKKGEKKSKVKISEEDLKKLAKLPPPIALPSAPKKGKLDLFATLNSGSDTEGGIALEPLSKKLKSAKSASKHMLRIHLARNGLVYILTPVNDTLISPDTAVQNEFMRQLLLRSLRRICMITADKDVYHHIVVDIMDRAIQCGANVCTFKGVKKEIMRVELATAPNRGTSGKLKVDLPKARMVERGEPKAFNITITPKGRIAIGKVDTTVDAAMVLFKKEMLKQGMFERSERMVLIRADKFVFHGVVLDLLKIAKLCGADRVAIATMQVR